MATCPPLTAPVNASDVRAPENQDRASASYNREQLARRARDLGEIRVIVGLQTPKESTRRAAPKSDEVKSREISAQQSRALERLSGHNVREVTRLRLHPFMTVTVDGAALDALFSDPDVTSVTEDGARRPMSYNTPVH